MRQYQSIWERLKSHKEASILADTSLHKRIIKAVIKEKYIDYGFKYTLADEGKSAKISYECDGDKITFTLQYAITLEDI